MHSTVEIDENEVLLDVLRVITGPALTTIAGSPLDEPFDFVNAVPSVVPVLGPTAVPFSWR